MEEGLNDPLDISKDLELIKDSQADIAKIDVLICGKCHESFCFLEEFQEHKTADKCTEATTLRCGLDEEPQVWGFTLWKNKQMRTLKQKEQEPPAPWDIYQQWVNLSQPNKGAWITAGKTLQYCNKLASAKIQEVGKLQEVRNEKDPLALDDGVVEGEDAKNDLSATQKFLNKISGKSFASLGQGVRTDQGDKEEFNVEKIVAKRFNPKKRYWEYQVKWENYEEQTWEPLIHLENCKALVESYEARIKAEKEKEKPAASRGRGRPRLSQPGSTVKIVSKKPTILSSSTTPTTPIIITTPGGRPQRTSKQKALNQVKQWCGNMSDNEESGTKRPYDDEDDSDDSFEKKMKFTGESEDTEEDEPAPSLKRVAKIIQYNNGVGKKIPDNVLIPDAKGVVRISQKQLPSLSSGVYIMSKSSGIIKLDPAASKIATSGGQAVVKVGPRVGHTQIKIIKKDDSGKTAVLQAKSEAAATPPKAVARFTPPVTVKPIQPVKKEYLKVTKKTEVSPKALAVTPKVVSKEKQEEKLNLGDEESDDGIEELEFPTDLPLPEPESPPGEFVLDPITGKVVGQEYPDPEIEPIITEPEAVTKEAQPSEPKIDTPIETLDNIVKLAAADITEEDLKPDEPVAVPVVTQPTAVITPIVPKPVVSEIIAPKSNQSILNTALANSNILQKTLLTPRAKTQPRVINQAVASKPRTTISPVIRTVTPKPNVIRKTPASAIKSKFNIAPMHPTPVKNVYSKANSVSRRIGNTTVTKTKTYPSPPPKHFIQKQPAQVPVSRPPPVKKVIPPPPKPALLIAPVIAPAAPKAVINMPSLALEEEPVVAKESVDADNSVQTFALATAADSPMFITGDDGTVYQVAGQNEKGQTILLTQDSDGQQQCLLVTNETMQDENETQQEAEEVVMEVQEPMEIAEEQPVVAQLLRAEPPSPGGTHKVVLMLPNGDVVMTQMSPEEYANLELEK